MILYQRTFFTLYCTLYLYRLDLISFAYHTRSPILSDVVIGDCVVLHDAPQRERISTQRTREMRRREGHSGKLISLIEDQPARRGPARVVADN